MAWASRFARFLQSAERSLLTIKNYLADLGAFIWWFEETNGRAFHPKDITPTDLREYKRTLIDHLKRKPSTVNRKLVCLQSFLRWAVDTGLLGHGRAPKSPKQVPVERRGPRWLDRREQNALLRAVERGQCTRDIAIVKLLLNTGVRVQELCSLTWQDVRLFDRKGTVTVRKSKGGKRREIPLNRDARTALLSLGYSKLAGKELPVFLGQRGPLTSRGVQIMLGKHLNASGLERLSPHILRHSFCKNLVNAGVGLEQVAALAGHESFDTTRLYCEPSLKDLERSVELIGEEE